MHVASSCFPGRSHCLPILLRALGFASAGAATPQEPFFAGLGDLRGGAELSQAFGISANGSTVVDRSNSGIGTEGFRWTEATGIVSLNETAGPNFAITAHGASADGSISVGSGRSDRGGEAFHWTEEEIFGISSPL